METKFTKSTDEKHKIKLESSILYGIWKAAVAYAGSEVEYEVRTLFVGEGSKIKISGESEKGKKLGELKDKIYRNSYSGKVAIPEDIEPGDTIYFAVELPQLGLSLQSNDIPVFPQIKVSNMRWEQAEVRRGDTVKIVADVEGVRDESEVKVIIYEYDEDGNHDRIAEIPTIAKKGRIDLRWQFEYHDTTLNIPTETELQNHNKEKHYAHPQYYFTIKIDNKEFGRDRESGFLVFKDQLDFRLLDDSGRPYANEDYIIFLADGKDIRGTLDEDGRGCELNLPPGEVMIVLPKKGRIFGK